jgi:hypothetical protein
VAHGFMTALSGSQIKPPALPEVADFVTIEIFNNLFQRIDDPSFFLFQIYNF